MALKTCPECGVEVPASATRCKECFHDFAEAPPRRWTAVIATLAVAAVMAVVTAVVLAALWMQPTSHDTFVDEATRSIVFTTQYRSGTETERLMWDEVASIKHVHLLGGGYEIVAVTITGDEHVLDASESDLGRQAKDFADLMGKPLVELDHSPAAVQTRTAQQD